MSELTIQPIGPTNIGDVACLLQKRSQTLELEAYVRWKYEFEAVPGQQGALAYQQGRPVGCFGLVSRQLRLANGREIRTGWFADWYVLPELRGQGVGQRLLSEITKQHSITIGHPGPPAAREACLRHGYKPLDFQARRRLILRRLPYETTRTNYIVKACFNAVFGKFKTAHAKLRAQLTQPKQFALSKQARFYASHQFEEWILTQPVSTKITRTKGAWHDNHLKIIFIDDQLSATEIRRRILFSEGENSYSLLHWRSFIKTAIKAGCLYLELFTTDESLDHTWARLGAVSYPDAPVLCYGSIPDPLVLHGWDRENWTYLASHRGQL